MDPFTLGALDDPYTAYADLRRRDPVHWSDELDAWVVTSFSANRDALHDPALSSRVIAGDQPPAQGGSSAEYAAAYTFVDRSLVFSDPPDHTRLRRLVSKAFTPAAITPLRQVVAAQATTLLDRAGPSLDLIHNLADPLPIQVLGSFLGIDLDLEAGRALKLACDEFLIPWGRSPDSLTPDEWDRARRAGAELTQFVDAVLDHRVDDGPGSDGAAGVMQRLLDGEADDHLSRHELFANIVLLLIAGHENLTSLLGNGAVILMDDSDARAALRHEHESLWPDIVEELLRLVTPNQFIRRQAKQPTRIGDRDIAAGDAVILVLAAANRDPEQFPDPDRFVLRRPNRRDLSLGQGIHYCLGAPLGRLEAEVGLQTLFERYPGMTVAERPLAYVNNFNVRLLQHLRVDPMTTSTPR